MAPMLDGRIYRMSLVIPALALVVLAFSLTGQPGALRSSLAPVAFNAGNVAATMRTLQARDPNRSPGSPGDDAVAADVARTLSVKDGYSVSTGEFQGETVHGERTLREVVATRAGTDSGDGSIVVVAPRDEPGLAGISSTAMLMELARVLSGQTLNRTIVLVSTSGSQGSAGAMHLAATLPAPVDAVLVLGDVASRRRSQPIIVPWTTRMAIAPARLRNTLAVALAGQSGIRANPPHVLSQLAHLAFPLTLSEQGVFGARGIPAVELSLSGERGPRATNAVVGVGALGGIGQGVLSAITALGEGSAVPAPSADVLFDGEMVPSWAISLFVLALIVPVVLTMIDGLARAHRRRYPVGRSLVATLAAATPFLAAGIVLLLARAVGTLRSPPGPVAPGAIPVTGGAIAAMALALLAALGCAALIRPLFASLITREPARPSRDSRTRAPERPGDGTAAAMLLVLCVVAVLVWLADPVAAALLVPALHLWLWAVDSDLPLPLPGRLAMLVLGVLPVAALVVFYAHSLGLGPGQLAWGAVLLFAGHIVSWTAAVEWSLVLGCLVSAVVLVIAVARRPEPIALPVSVRGPINYAGPGSLGGTKSALRR
jgi:hypothetical protein